MKAIADDVHAVYYNPAGLGNLKRVEVTGMHNTQIQGINYEFAAVAVPLLSWVDTKLDRNLYGVLGFAAYNLSVSGIQRRGLTETDSPADIFSASYLFTDKLLVALDMNAPRDDNAKMAAGAEYRHPFNEKLTGFLRGGYNMRHADNGGVSGASMGVGIGYNNFNFDFAWVPYGDLGNTFRYSLHVKF